MAELGPYENPYAKQMQQWLREVIEDNIPFEEIATLYDESSPELFVGAVNVLTDEFRVFDGSEITPDTLLASAALPPLFRAVELDDGLYWDGLLSENPPIQQFTTINPNRPTDFDPDEIWVIQLDPEEQKEEPKSIKEISDRRQALAGNLSLDQEINAIDRLNEMIDRGIVDHEDYTHTEIRRMVLSDTDLGYASKFDRDPEFIRDLIDHGEEVTNEFFDEGT